MKELLACQVYIRADAVQWYLWGSSNQAIWISNACASCGELSLMSHDCASGAFFPPLVTIQAEFLERYGRLMPKEQWPQLVGPRHFGWSEGRCMKLIYGCKMILKGNAGLLWPLSTSNICIPLRLVGRLRTRQVEQPEKVKLLVAVATLVSQNSCSKLPLHHWIPRATQRLFVISSPSTWKTRA